MTWQRIRTIALLAIAFGPFTYFAGDILVDYIQSGGKCPYWKSTPSPCTLWERYTTVVFANFGVLHLMAGIAWAALCLVVYGLIFGMIKGYRWFTERVTQKDASKEQYSTYQVKQSSQATSKHMPENRMTKYI